jgi:2,3-bisphosphoglycerate-independent phosphoglycerate mutase
MVAKKRKVKKTRKTKAKKSVKKPKKASSGRKRRKKIVFIVVDGLADKPQKGKTPLNEAKTPNMDWLAANGACGELTIITKGLWKKIDYKGISQYGNVSLLGYNPARYSLDRGPLEAVGSGVPYNEGHLAVRCNFATVGRNMVIKDRRAGRNTYGLDEIARHINKTVKIGSKYIFMRTYGHRAVLVIKKQLSDKVEGNDTGVGKALGKVTAMEPDAEESARLIQEFLDKSRNAIQFHSKNSERIDKGILPANYLLVRQPGNKLCTLPDFAKRWKLNGAICISENGVMKATCMLAGFSSINVPEFDSHSDWLDFIFENVDAALSEYDFVYAHIKGADVAAHDKSPAGKRKIIEDIDAHLESFRNFNGILILTCDHITSSVTGKHEYGPVPVFVYGRKKDSVKKFDEQSVKGGSLGKGSGRKLLKYVFGK